MPGPIGDALAMAGLEPTDVDLLVSTSVTGIAAPSLDARLVPVLGLRPDVRRIPVFGLGCVAGAAGVARVHDLLRGDPDAVAVLLSVELCSLTVQRDDASMANLVASGLFGDGAAAVVMVGERRAASARPPGSAGDRHPQPALPGHRAGDGLGHRRQRLPDRARPPACRSWSRSTSGTTSTPSSATTTSRSATSTPGWPTPAARRCSRRWPGPLDLPASALRRTWASLARVGNLSSASVLHVLADTLADPPPPPGAPGVLMAMGPGFCAELVLLRW